jgi:hypothetical protein
VPLIAVENALVLAAARRLMRPASSPPLGTIRSLAHFSPVIEEVSLRSRQCDIVDAALKQDRRRQVVRRRQATGLYDTLGVLSTEETVREPFQKTRDPLRLHLFAESDLGHLPDQLIGQSVRGENGTDLVASPPLADPGSVPAQQPSARQFQIVSRGFK